MESKKKVFIIIIVFVLIGLASFGIAKVVNKDAQEEQQLESIKLAPDETELDIQEGRRTSEDSEVAEDDSEYTADSTSSASTKSSKKTSKKSKKSTSKSKSTSNSSSSESSQTPEPKNATKNNETNETSMDLNE